MVKILLCNFAYFLKIDFPEFLTLMSGCHNTNNDVTGLQESSDEKRAREREEELCDLFYLFDKDRSGSISADELSSVMYQFGGLTKAELDVMIGEADVDGDGQVISVYVCNIFHYNIIY